MKCFYLGPLFTALILVVNSATAISNTNTPSKEAKQQPNFLVVIADDMGWSDLGFLGSKINTPNLDELAQQGVFMSDFYVAPTCSPTRAMFFTGLSNHAAGVGTMHNMAAPNQTDSINYKAQLHDGVVTVAEALRSQGYRTMMSGKWHLAAVDEDQRPQHRGFERSFGLIQGGGSHFADQRIITPAEGVTYLEDGEPIELPVDFYSSINYADKIIDYIGAEDDAPFFAYLAFTAPHDPLQVPDNWLDRYDGVFDDGPEPARLARREKLIELQLIASNAAQNPAVNFPAWLPSHRKAWDERSLSDKDNSARRMEIYASMVELMDQEFGRVISHLEQTGKRDNTYILFFSDNGASASSPYVYVGVTRDWANEYHDLSYEQMGRPRSYTTMGADWVHLSNTPFNLYKGTVADGGVRSPLIVSGPRLPKGTIARSPAHVMDLSSTIYELAGITPAELPIYNNKLLPAGQSILPVLKGDSKQQPRYLISELFGQKMVRKGKWKAEFRPPPFGNQEWELFDTETDPGSTVNLASEYPDLIQAIAREYEQFAKQNGVIAPNIRMSVKSNVTFEGDCDRWCLLRFGIVDVLVNPAQRNKALFFMIALVIGLAWFFIARRRAKQCA